MTTKNDRAASHALAKTAMSSISPQEYENKTNGNNGAVPSGMGPAIGGMTMFASSVFAGFIPIIPYLFLSGSYALVSSIIVSMIALSILGYVSALAIKAKPIRRAVRMLMLGGSAIIIGVIVSVFVRVA